MTRPRFAPLAYSPRPAAWELPGPRRDAGAGGHASFPCDGHARCSLSFTVPSGVTARGRLPEWPKGAVCKTVGLAYPGSNPGPATTSGNAPELARLSSGLILSHAAVCGLRHPHAGRCVKYVPKFGGLAPDHLLVVPRPRGFLDAALGFVLLAGDALGVDTQQYVHAVARPVGCLGGGHSRVQPGGNRRVPQVVGAPGKQGRPFLAAEGC